MGQAALKSIAKSQNLDMSSALDVVSKYAAEGRENRRISQPVIDALIETGYFRSALPKKYGGLELSPSEFFRASIDIAERDMGTSWACGIIAIHAFQLAMMDPKACEDVYGETGADTLISSSYNPAGAKVETVDGGFKLSGRWGWSSGSAHCDWVLLGGLIFDQGTENIHYRTFLVPKPDYAIEDTWFPMGLHCTGSNDIVIEEPCFVPTYRTHHQMDGFNGVHPQESGMYDIPWAQTFIRVVCSAAIGGVKHALQLFIDNATKSSTDVTRLAGDPDVTRRIAEVANMIDETEVVLYRNFDKMMMQVESGVEIPLIDRIKYRYQASLVIEKMIKAIDLLFDIAGGRSVYDGSPIQEIWHDVHIARAHVANNPVSFARNYGSVLLGAENTDFFL